MCTWKHVSTQHAFLCTCSSFTHNYYALFDPVSNSSTFLENSSFKQLTAFDFSTTKRLNLIKSIFFFQDHFQISFQNKIYQFRSILETLTVKILLVRLQILFSFLFFSFLFWTVSICRITCDVVDPIATSRSQDLSDVPRNIWMANCSLYHRASPIECCQQNGGCNSRLGIFNLSSTTWRNNTCTGSQSLRYCTNENGRSTIHKLEYLQQCKNIFGFSPSFACTNRPVHMENHPSNPSIFFPRISDSSVGMEWKFILTNFSVSIRCAMLISRKSKKKVCYSEFLITTLIDQFNLNSNNKFLVFDQRIKNWQRAFQISS